MIRKRIQAPSPSLQASGSPALPSSLQPPASSLSSRRAFSLTELLVVISIIGMLAGISLGALYSARETGRKAKTKATITKLDMIIQAKYAEFFSRRMPIQNRRIPPDAMAELKFRVLQEIMRMEMPDRARDIVFPRREVEPSLALTDAAPVDILAEVKPLASYAANSRSDQYFIDIQGRFSPMKPSFANVSGFQRTALGKRYFRRVVGSSFLTSTNFDSAECLYMIIQADPEAREQFQPGEIGDADEDGFFEFHDGWDRPIMFLRWAPGFAGESDLMSGDGAQDLDPMNPRRIGDLYADAGKWTRPGNDLTFRLVPLIYSGGPDKKYGINSHHGDPSDPGWTVQYGSHDPSYPYETINKVWDTDPAVGGGRIGSPITDAAHDEYDAYHDNITNHSLGMN
ncbi:MAG: type II secretion system protein [bacterium]|nr:type II secretion system protein [bacterium]